MSQQQRRNRFIIGILALGLLAGVALTAGPAQAVDAPGPYYAKPAWDQKLAAATRFVVLTNWFSAAVLDKETGLVWERSPNSVLYAWVGARAHCTALTTGDRKGWRLPSVHELASLVDPSAPFPDPMLPPGHPFTNVQPFYYWSATTEADAPARAWDVPFFAGGGSFSKVTSLYAWCVRGGMKAGQY